MTYFSSPATLPWNLESGTNALIPCAHLSTNSTLCLLTKGDKDLEVWKRSVYPVCILKGLESLATHEIAYILQLTSSTFPLTTRRFFKALDRRELIAQQEKSRCSSILLKRL